MVSILLFFTRAQRDGSWELHLYAFMRMLPFFFRYDHVKYARWGTVYLFEMAQLPPDILHEFQHGHIVIKQTNRLFNQVSPDQSTQWLNATGQKSGGLVGITKVASALSRWTMSYNLCTLIASQTKQGNQRWQIPRPATCQCLATFTPLKSNILIFLRDVISLLARVFYIIN